jgi:dTDP-4-amino-4,6-dideoxygalactose transaminase
MLVAIHSIRERIDKELTNQITTSVNYGSQKKYFYKYCVGNSRLDEVHAAVLDVKLHHLDDDNEWRMKVA